MQAVDTKVDEVVEIVTDNNSSVRDEEELTTPERFVRNLVLVMIIVFAILFLLKDTQLFMNLFKKENTQVTVQEEPSLDEWIGFQAIIPSQESPAGEKRENDWEAYHRIHGWDSYYKTLEEVEARDGNR